MYGEIISDLWQEEQLQCFRCIIASFQKLLALYVTDACGDSLLQHGHHAEWAIPKKKGAMLRIITVYAWHTSKLRTSKDGNYDDTRLQKTWKLQNIVFSNKHHVFSSCLRFQGFWRPQVYIYIYMIFPLPSLTGDFPASHV